MGLCDHASFFFQLVAMQKLSKLNGIPGHGKEAWNIYKSVLTGILSLVETTFKKNSRRSQTTVQ